MQFLITAYDASDDGALERRMAAREAHLALAAKNKEAGHALFGAAILNEEEQMVGSIMVVDYPSLDEVEAWLEQDPYVTGDVWEDVSVQLCKVAPSFKK